MFKPGVAVNSGQRRWYGGGNPLLGHASLPRPTVPFQGEWCWPSPFRLFWVHLHRLIWRAIGQNEHIGLGLWVMMRERGTRDRERYRARERERKREKETQGSRGTWPEPSSTLMAPVHKERGWENEGDERGRRSPLSLHLVANQLIFFFKTGKITL